MRIPLDTEHCFRLIFHQSLGRLEAKPEFRSPVSDHRRRQGNLNSLQAQRRLVSLILSLKSISLSTRRLDVLSLRYDSRPALIRSLGRPQALVFPPSMTPNRVNS